MIYIFMDFFSELFELSEFAIIYAGIYKKDTMVDPSKRVINAQIHNVVADILPKYVAITYPVERIGKERIAKLEEQLEQLQYV